MVGYGVFSRFLDHVVIERRRDVQQFMRAFETARERAMVIAHGIDLVDIPSTERLLSDQCHALLLGDRTIPIFFGHIRTCILTQSSGRPFPCRSSS